MSENAGRTRIPRAFFDRPVLEVAPDLLGRTLVHRTPEGVMEIRLTEVEAYAGEIDPGSHAFRGRTARNAVMFGPPGHVYVYFTYGMWHCMNLVCGPEGQASGVLLRAGEILRGAELARPRRRSARADRELAKGPARLATALGVALSLNGTDACADTESPLGLLTGTPPAPELVRSGPRTGVGGEGAPHPWRFWIEADPTVSPYRAHTPRRRRLDSGGANA
ncbi:MULTISPECIES: DNA-3-methyladenine glycosylase [unclassified Streptomyces]|uniref:DNA-3-methyladenine glycosylase n=1 Tax=unclassified Streptomyces TaxID=2593676 RepID=UPI0016602BD4|nr:MULTISPECIES: DNA-3-methyladenine glycosylase [unclassified Streptomyces]MBD0709897.1 3-methyladenine DNA glycosylase [Streptomyces sp. CBMA291]MBD0716907.1 3-methyladenine DNA glycosylase [Streptomyces sp. CBMA370]